MHSKHSICISERESDVSDTCKFWNDGDGVCDIGLLNLSKLIVNLRVRHEKLCYQNFTHVKHILSRKGVLYFDDFVAC